jgi:hypothetical protein
LTNFSYCIQGYFNQLKNDLSCKVANIIRILGKSTLDTYDTIAIATASHEDINKFSAIWCVFPIAILSNTENSEDGLMIWLQFFLRELIVNFNTSISVIFCHLNDEKSSKYLLIAV